MSADRNNEHDVDRLLKRILRDDLPSEAESRMRKRLAAFRQGLESCDVMQAGRSDRIRGCLRAFMQRLSHHPMVRREALAGLSAVMLVAGIVIHLGGYQNVLADSIYLLKTSMSVAEHMRLADSMDCVIKLSKAGTQTETYRIRWIRSGRTRVDAIGSRSRDETMWFTEGRGMKSSLADRAQYPVSGLQKEVIALLSPTDLARRLDLDWQLQPDKKRLNNNMLVYVDRLDRSVIEMLFDKRSLLPVNLSWRPSEASRQVGSFDAVSTAEFTWNQPVAPELMVPRLKPGR